MPETITIPCASISLTFTKVGSPVIKPYRKDEVTEPSGTHTANR